MTHQELTDAERADIRREVERLREEHRDLDVAIEALDRVGAVDRLQMQTTGSSAPLPDSLQSIRGGIGEFAVDAKVAARLHWDKELEGTSIQVGALGGGVVKLSGTVSSMEARQHAVHLARTTTGVSNVVDELTSPP